MDHIPACAGIRISKYVIMMNFVQVEKGAGAGARWSDEEYVSHGAKVVETDAALKADIVLKVSVFTVMKLFRFFAACLAIY